MYTDIEPTNNERFLVRPEVTTVDISSGCERSEPYERATFNTLVKEGKLTIKPCFVITRIYDTKTVSFFDIERKNYINKVHASLFK